MASSERSAVMGNQGGANSRSGFSFETLNLYIGLVYAFIALSICTAVVCCPFLIAVFVAPSVEYYALWIAGAVCSAPGLAALFAAFRDCPMVSFNQETRAERSRENGEDAPADYIAGSYWNAGEDTRIFRPFFRAYKTLFLRGLRVGATFGVLTLFFVYDSVFFTQFHWGIYVVPAMAICAAFSIAAGLVALVLAVEFPKARWWVSTRNAVYLACRRWYMTLLNLVVLVLYFWVATKYPFIVIPTIVSLLFYAIWGDARWQAMPMFTLMYPKNSPRFGALASRGESGDATDYMQ